MFTVTLLTLLSMGGAQQDYDSIREKFLDAITEAYVNIAAEQLDDAFPVRGPIRGPSENSRVIKKEEDGSCSYLSCGRGNRHPTLYNYRCAQGEPKRLSIPCDLPEEIDEVYTQDPKHVPCDWTNYIGTASSRIDQQMRCKDELTASYANGTACAQDKEFYRMQRYDFKDKLDHAERNAQKHEARLMKERLKINGETLRRLHQPDCGRNGNWHKR